MTADPIQPGPRFYERAGLTVETYDLRHPMTMDGTPLAGDVEFYQSLATELSGPVLELACGTGRVAFALAEAGFDVVGLDRSEPMLALAHEKLKRASPQAAQNLTFVHGDMANFDLDREFALVVIAFRSFQSLLTGQLQRACLQATFRHMRPGGLLAMDLFDPQLDACAPQPPLEVPSPRADVRLPNGNRVLVTVVDRDLDPVTQVMRETWRFVETDQGANNVRVEEEELLLRWSYRYEIRHLLELTGFHLVAEYSDFHRSPPAYGKELVLVASRLSGEVNR